MQNYYLSYEIFIFQSFLRVENRISCACQTTNATRLFILFFVNRVFTFSFQFLGYRDGWCFIQQEWDRIKFEDLFHQEVLLIFYARTKARNDQTVSCDRIESAWSELHMIHMYCSTSFLYRMSNNASLFSCNLLANENSCLNLNASNIGIKQEFFFMKKRLLL